jgi:hypothetical protein
VDRRYLSNVTESFLVLNDLHWQRLEVMGRHEALNADLNRLKSQYQVNIFAISFAGLAHGINIPG